MGIAMDAMEEALQEIFERALCTIVFNYRPLRLPLRPLRLSFLLPLHNNYL